MVNPACFGGKLGGGCPVVSWKIPEMTLREGCRTDIGGVDNNPVLIRRRAQGRHKEDRDICTIETGFDPV